MTRASYAESLDAERYWVEILSNIARVSVQVQTIYDYSCLSFELMINRVNAPFRFIGDPGNLE